MKLKDVTLEQIKDFLDECKYKHENLFNTSIITNKDNKEVLELELFYGYYDDFISVCEIWKDEDYAYDFCMETVYKTSYFDFEIDGEDYEEDDDGDIVVEIKDVVEHILLELKFIICDTIDDYKKQLEFINSFRGLKGLDIEGVTSALGNEYD